MSRRANPTVVGAFVVGALVLAVAGVLVFGSGLVLRDRVTVVGFFEGNVRGLQEGSAVEFRGVRVGTVKQISLVFDVDTKELQIPILMELDARSLTLAGKSLGGRDSGAVPFLDELVAQGLRARLDLKSFVTGQLAVTLDMQPDTAIRRVGAVTDVYELPTVPSTLDRFAAVLQDLPLQDIAAKLIKALDSASHLLGDERLSGTLGDAAATVAEGRRLIGELRGKAVPVLDDLRAMLGESRTTLAEVSRRANTALDGFTDLARDAGARLDSLATRAERAVSEVAAIRASLDARVAPVTDSATAAFGEARGALANARTLLEEDSRTLHNLNAALEELAAAARSLRIMADYLEQNPDALIKGRGR